MSYDMVTQNIINIEQNQIFFFKPNNIGAIKVQKQKDGVPKCLRKLFQN